MGVALVANLTTFVPRLVAAKHRPNSLSRNGAEPRRRIAARLMLAPILWLELEAGVHRVKGRHDGAHDALLLLYVSGLDLHGGTSGRMNRIGSAASHFFDGFSRRLLRRLVNGFASTSGPQ